MTFECVSRLNFSLVCYPRLNEMTEWFRPQANNDGENSHRISTFSRLRLHFWSHFSSLSFHFLGCCCAFHFGTADDAFRQVLRTSSMTFAIIRCRCCCRCRCRRKLNKFPSLAISLSMSLRNLFRFFMQFSVKFQYSVIFNGSTFRVSHKTKNEMHVSDYLTRLWCRQQRKKEVSLMQFCGYDEISISVKCLLANIFLMTFAFENEAKMKINLFRHSSVHATAAEKKSWQKDDDKKYKIENRKILIAKISDDTQKFERKVDEIRNLCDHISKRDNN